MRFRLHLPVLAAVPFLLASCGVRLDDARRLSGVNAGVAAAQLSEVGPAGVSVGRPSVRELREARGAAMQEWDQLLNGGMPLYRGDGASSNINSVRFAAAPGALTLDYAASPMLNASDGEAHALTLVVYHLTDRAAFDQLARHEEGIRKLLEGDFFDASVAGVRTHSVQPGAAGRLVEDRYEGGKYVALVAGYGGLRARTAVHVTEYRVYQWNTAGGTVFSRDRTMYSPYPLHLRAALDVTEMRVEDADTTLNRMRGVTNLQRAQVFADLRPASRSEAAEFANSQMQSF
jgi:predicted component of type VI protein secretion system